VATAAILPIKRFDHAKQRLGKALGASTREALAAAMCADVLAQIKCANSLDAVLVVSGEPRVRELAREAGATLLDDPAETGQSPAALAGLAQAAADGFERALLVPGDCPLLDPGELDLLVRGFDQDVVIVRDRHSTGTNALLLDPTGPFEPQFGPGSLARHQQQAEDKGLEYSVATVFSLGLDVDTDADLQQLAIALDGVSNRGVNTREVLSRMSSAAA
jgi:2-phospho-L-lactate guanylyltransferase